jgi:hypothetical protein
MLQNDPKHTDKDHKDSAIQPDPETLGPEPQEHMDGPISTLVRKVGEKMDENDQDVEPGEETEK